MSLIEKFDLDSIPKFSNNKAYLSIIERKAPLESDAFFKKLLQIPFSINGEVYKKSSVKDVQSMIDEFVCREVKNNLFYNYWIKDMANISKVFCQIMESDFISFSLAKH